MQLPDNAAFCMKCGTQLHGFQQPSSPNQSSTPVAQNQVIAPHGASSLKCPNCGAPISPKFGEMVITCEYCGSAVTLGSQGWASIKKQTMLPLKFPSKDAIVERTRELMDHGLLHRHLQEHSSLEECNLSIIPYWILSVSARTSVVATDATAEVGTLATTAALFGVMGGMGGQRGGGFGGGLLDGALIGGMMGGGMGGGNMKKTYQMDENYNYPIVALKALTEYQPRDYQFLLEERTIFDVSKVPQGIKILNGDISEEVAKSEARTLVDQLQSQKAHKEHHMIQEIHTDEDVADGELMYTPVWFVRYAHKENKIVLVMDGNSGSPINSIGL